MKGMFKKAPETLNQNSDDSSKVGANSGPTILKRHPQMSCLCEGAAGTRSGCALLGDVTVSPVGWVCGVHEHLLVARSLPSSAHVQIFYVHCLVALLVLFVFE